jgi:hypothetical protein
MYWSGCQSTGAEIRKYLTTVVLADNTRETSNASRMFDARRHCTTMGARTVVDLLECDDAVRWEALLSVLV